MSDNDVTMEVGLPEELHTAVSNVAANSNSTIHWLIRGCLTHGYQDLLEWSSDEIADVDPDDIPFEGIQKWGASDMITAEFSIPEDLHATLIKVSNRINYPIAWLIQGCIADGYQKFTEWSEEDFDDLGVADIPITIRSTDSEISTMICFLCGDTLTKAGMDYGPSMNGYCAGHGLVGVEYD